MSAAALSPDHRVLAAATEDGVVRFINITDGSEKFHQSMPAAPNTMAFSPDGKTLATGAANGDVALWDVSVGDKPGLRLRTEMKGHAGLVRTIVYSLDGTLLATTAEDHIGIVWDARKGQLLARLTSDPARVLAVAFHPSGKRLAVAEGRPFSGNRDGTVRIIDWPSCKTVATSREPLGGAFSVAYSSDGRVLLSGGNSGIVRLRDPETGQVVENLLGHTNRIHVLTVTPDGRHLLSGGNDRTARLWTLPTKPVVETLQTSFKIGATARSADGKTLMTAARNGRIVKRWDIASGALLATEETEIAWGDWLAISPDGTTLATQTKDHKILLWNSKARKSKSLSGHSAEVTSLAFSPDGRFLASGSADGTARLWDVVDIQNARECGRFSHKEGRVYCVRFSPDGTTLAAGTTHDGVTLWDVASGTMRHSFPSRDGTMVLAYSADGKRIAAGSWGAKVTIWNLDRAAEPIVCEGHTMPVRALAFAPDGQSVVSCGDDQNIKFWDAKSGQERFSIADAHTSELSELWLSRDGLALVTLGTDGDVKIWRAAAESEEDLFDWHSRRATECKNNRQWSLAAEHLDWLIASGPDRWKSFIFERLVVNGELGRWEHAADDYLRMLPLPRYADAPDHEKMCAIYQLAAGRTDAYRRMCADMIRRAGPEPSSTMASSIIYGTVAVPDSVPDFSVLLPLARVGIKEHGGGERIFAATLCRAGHYAEALEQFEQSQKVWPPRAWDWLFMAMCHHHLKQDRQAEECFANARRWIAIADELRTKAQATTWDKSWFNPPERFEVQLLEREVESLLKDRAD